MTGATEALARLRDAPWLRSPALSEVFAALDSAAGTTRVVGGAVRDTLLGRIGTGAEIDLATALTPEEVTARARARHIAVIPTGIDFGTVTLVCREKSFEVTTLRQDIETDGRHAVVRFGDDWIEDAQRRDFTLNALYCGPEGDLFDPLGGLADCLACRVRFIGDPSARIAEDRLRVFRFFRFSASHGGETFDPEALAASTVAARDLGPVSAERIGHEMIRILALPKCARTLGAMTDSGLLDIGTQTLDWLRLYETVAESPGAVGRLALLVKGNEPDELKGRWRLSNALVKAVREARDAAGLLHEGRVAEVAYRHPDARQVALDIAATRAGWSERQHSEVRTALFAYAPPDFPVSGALLLRHGFAPGPELGAQLSRLERAWIDSGFTLTQAQLLGLARVR